MRSRTMKYASLIINRKEVGSRQKNVAMIAVTS